MGKKGTREYHRRGFEGRISPTVGQKRKKRDIRGKEYRRKKDWVGKRGRGIEVPHLDVKQGEKEREQEGGCENANPIAAPQ